VDCQIILEFMHEYQHCDNLFKMLLDYDFASRQVLNIQLLIGIYFVTSISKIA
jgi:hypothetical protein